MRETIKIERAVTTYNWSAVCTIATKHFKWNVWLDKWFDFWKRISIYYYVKKSQKQLVRLMSLHASVMFFISAQPWLLSEIGCLYILLVLLINRFMITVLIFKILISLIFNSNDMPIGRPRSSTSSWKISTR